MFVTDSQGELFFILSRDFICDITKLVFLQFD